MSKLIKFSTVLSGANSVVRSALSYPKRRQTHRLYKQWVEKDGLQTEVAPVPMQTAGAEQASLTELHHDTVRARAAEAPKVANGVNSPVPQRKVAVFMMAEIDREQLRLPILLVLLGASLVIFCLGLILLIVYSFGL